MVRRPFFDTYQNMRESIPLLVVCRGRPFVVSLVVQVVVVVVAVVALA